MKILSFFALVFFMIQFNVEEKKAPTLAIEKYCNNRFDFCVTYDAGIFNKVPPDLNADGITITDKSGTVFLDCYGSFNPYKLSTAELMKRNMAYLLRNEPSGLKKMIRESKDDKSYIIIFETEDTYFKQEMVSEKLHYRVITLQVPVRKKTLIENVTKTSHFVPNTLMASS